MKFGYEFNENLTTPLQHKRLMRELNYLEGNVHKYEVLPQHFEKGASSKYHYQKRTSKYLAKKFARWGEVRPDLVSEGNLKTNTLHNAKVTAVWDHWRVYCNKVAPHQIPAWMRDEIERRNKSEITDSCRRLGRNYKKFLPQYLRKRRVKG
jgi:hypothetical protein